MMNRTERIRVVELRNYLLKPGMRERFTDYFARHFMDSQNALGARVLGGFAINAEPDRFFWIRGFSDITTRSRFLPEFYNGDFWKKFGGEANAMMLEWHNVYLLNPLRAMRVEDFFSEKKLAVIDYYFAEDGRMAELIGGLKTKNFPDTSFWTTERAENDFPQLPVIREENLLAAITNYADEAELDLRDLSSKSGGEDFLRKHERLILTRAF